MTYEEFLKLTKKNLTIFSGIFSGKKSGNHGGVKK